MALAAPSAAADPAAAPPSLTPVAIAGATGYAGQELVRLLARHPAVTLTVAMSSGAGSPARTLSRTMGLARAQGLKVGLLRPITLAPFPSARLRALSDHVRAVVLLEAAPSPWSDAVRTAVGGRAPVRVLRGAAGTGLPSAEELLPALGRLLELA